MTKGTKMASPIHHFSLGVAEYLKTSILPSIVEFYRQKGIVSSVDEIVQFLNISIDNPKNNIIASSSSSHLTTKGPGRKKQTDIGLCKYVYQKHDRLGQTCGKPVKAYGYCGACIKKKPAKEDLLSQGLTHDQIDALSKPKTNSAIQSSVINNIIPTINSGSVPTTITSNIVPDFIKVNTVDDNDDTYMLKNIIPGILVKFEGNIKNAFCRLQDEKLIPLTVDEKRILISNNFKVSDFYIDEDTTKNGEHKSEESTNTHPTSPVNKVEIPIVPQVTTNKSVVPQIISTIVPQVVPQVISPIVPQVVPQIFSPVVPQVISPIVPQQFVPVQVASPVIQNQIKVPSM